MHIKSFALSEIGPFDDIAFSFDEQVNVLVGENNTGKSCALVCLGEVCVFPFGIPRKYFRVDKKAKFRIDVEHGRPHGGSTYSGVLPIDMDIGTASLKELHRYTKLLRQLGYTAFVPALRWGTEFRATGPTTEAQKAKLEEKKERLTYVQQLARTFPHDPKAHQKSLSLANSIDAELEKRRGIFEHSSALAQDRPIVQAIIDLDYKGYRQSSSNIRRLLERIPAIASEITEGFPLEFAGVGEDERGLFPKFKTPDGVMPLHALSQGTQSILHWIAHLLIGLANYHGFPAEPENCPGILIVDEIDAHLHPSWQRRILSTLTKNFKSLQVFCSTHSPLMLAGLRRGQIILLKRSAKGGVVYSKNANDIVSWSADEILRNLLDVPSPTDVATEEKLRRLEVIREKDNLSPAEEKELRSLRNQVSHMLFSAAAATDVCSTTSGRERVRKQSPPRKSTPQKRVGVKRFSKK